MGPVRVLLIEDELTLAQAVGLATAATLVAGYFPARWAAQQPVVEGLREE